MEDKDVKRLIQEQLGQVVTQLDALIRGRKIDLVLLRLKASVLLASSFELEGEKFQVSSHEGITKQGIKIHNMLRSPRFLTKDGQNVFLILRVAVTNIITLLKVESDSTNSVLEYFRLNAKSASELRQIQEFKENALKVILFIEKKWESLDGNFISRFLPIELKECEKIVAEALVAKADILAEQDQIHLALSVIKSRDLTNLLKGSENAGLVLATKTFKYGQQILITRESSTNPSKAGIAALCFETSLEFLEKPVDARSNYDQISLKSKCLVQLGLALHLDQRHDEALERLNQVSSDVLIQDTEDLRFGILQATDRFDELHRCIQGLIENIQEEGFKSPMRLGDTSEVTRILLWVRRIAIATHFDEPSFQHYRDLQAKWQDDHRYLEVRTQFLSGLLANHFLSPTTSISTSSLSPSSHSSSTSIPENIRQALTLCDDILCEHEARQRILSAKHFVTIEGALIHALNASFRIDDHHSVIEVSLRFTRCIELSSHMESGNSIKNQFQVNKQTFHDDQGQGEKYAYALLMRADAFFEIGRLSNAFEVANVAFEIKPSTEAFIIKFQSIFFGGGTLEECQSIVQAVIKSEFATPACALDALFQVVAIISECATHTAVDHSSLLNNEKRTSIKHLDDLEITALIAYVRAFEYFISSEKIKPSSNNENNQNPSSSTPTIATINSLPPSYAAFLLRVFFVGKEGEQNFEEENKEESSSEISHREEKRLLSSTQCLLSGTHFLLQEESHGHLYYSNANNMKLFSSFEEVQNLSSACWDIARNLGDRGMLQCGGVDEGGFTVITNLLLAAHELQIVAERIQKKSMTTISSHQLNENALNRVGLLTMAASEVINQGLLPVPTLDQKATQGRRSSVEILSENQKDQIIKALEWVEMAQGLCKEINKRLLVDSEDSQMVHQAKQITSLRVTISTLKLMAGLHGMYLIPPNAGSEEEKSTNTTDMLLQLVEDCKEDLGIVPPDTLRAAASAMKQQGKPAVAFRLLKIAIDRIQSKNSSLGVDMESKGHLIMYSCDLFHVSPTTDICLEIIEDILEFLGSPLNSLALTERQFIDPDAIEILTCNCYNWGIQGLTLGLMNSASESERLIGKAQELLPYCPNLAHHEEDFTQAYQRALEAKEQQHEALVIHAQQMDSKC